MPLNDMICRTVKPTDRPFKISDGGGLYLQVMPSGSKYWRLKYRIHKKERRIALGVYPEITLSAARDARGKIKTELKNGIDPTLARLQEKQIAIFTSAQTFRLIAIEWHGKNSPVWDPKYAKTMLHRLEKYLFPHIGDYPITELTPQIILACLQKIEKTGPDMARRIKQICSNVF